MTGQELKELRLRWGLTQSKLGEKLGITASAVAHLESGKNTMSKPVALLVTILTAKQEPSLNSSH